MPHNPGRTISVNGARLHVEERGDDAGPEILFLHGGAGTIDDWDCVIDTFADCRCVLLDTRGHGASTMGGGDLTYPRLAQDAEAVIAGCGLSSPIIIGHSDGGITGIHVAARGKAKLRGLATIGAHGDVPRADILRNVYAPLTPAKWRARFPDMIALYEKLNPEPDFDRLFTQLLAMWRNAGPGNYPGELASRIGCPALIVAGDNDHLVPREETVQLAGAIKGARLGIIPYGSHVPHWEHPDRVIPYLRQFVDEASGTK